ncbi:chaoptin-like isoform X2 [Limulus polyphemus]|uniref:Chaoptin-like isoform X2 n=1 Tax=Limulus polyphemus TaxID=6850 RepID=A0ABM1SII2_LIMPO|nr:chaoptin-like isoform X2 [Limulus polyphemus]
MVSIKWKLVGFMCGFLVHASATSVSCSFNPLCTCITKQQDISCVDVPFLSFPKIPFKEVYQLTLAKTGLPELYNDSLVGTAVSSLRLMYNNLVTLPLRAFHSSEQVMTSLDLSYNHINNFPAKALQKLSYLQWLNLQFNEVEELKRGVFENLRSQSAILSILLSNNHILFIEDSVFENLRNLTFLDLANNHINKLEGHPFPDSLTYLSLSENLLNWIPPGALSNLKNLIWLNLGGNLLSSLPKDWKLSVRHLKELDFSRNSLTKLHSNIFNGSFSVYELNLSYNYLRVLPLGAFRGLSIKWLSLANNRLSSIPVGAFEGLEATLIALDLSFNMLRSFPKALKELNDLKKLSIRGNQLPDLKKYDLYTFREHLEVLDLSRNLLKNVPREGLVTSKRLLSLSLQDNQIKQVNAHDLYGWGSSLLFLNLANNRISYISAKAFFHSPKIQELKLSYNNLVNMDSKILFPLRKSLKAVEIGSLFKSHYDHPEMMANYLDKIEWLQMDHNKIIDLTPTIMLGLTNLIHCDLEGNNIKMIPQTLFRKETHGNLSNVILSHNEVLLTNSKTFNELPRLRNVVLLGNRLEIVRYKSFSSCPMLKAIVLSHNRLRVIEPSAFYNLTRLTSVFLQFNNLSRFSFNMFSNVSNPDSPMHVNFSNNHISHLDLYSSDGDIDDTIHIQTLDLSHNNISMVPQGFFKRLEISFHRLYLSFNNLNVVPSSVFNEATYLQILQLDHNSIAYVNSMDFQGNSSIQILNLSYNNISSISSEAFTALQKLRIVDMSYNRVATLPENAFVGTKLEKINLSHNVFVLPPLKSFFPVRNTLQFIDISTNQIAVIHSNEISPLYRLNYLNLSSNQLINLAVGNLSQLINLDVSHNSFRRFDDAPFYQMRSLRSLSLKNTNLSHISFLPLSKLNALSLANNLFKNISEFAFRHLRHLRHLDLSHNLMQEVPCHLWDNVADLHTLDISHNPIEVLGTVSFSGLKRLVELDMRGLNLKYLDSRTLYELRFLETFKTGTYAGVRSFRLHDLLHKSASLRRVVVEVEESTLSHHIQWTFGAKLRDLTITGHNLQHVLPDAFLGLHHTHELILRITGGVLLENNPWKCGCDLIWLSHWLRRWMRETLRVQMLHFDAVLYVYNLARRSTCIIPGTNIEIPIIDLRSKDMNCLEDHHNSAVVTSLHFHGSFIISGLVAMHWCSNYVL